MNRYNSKFWNAANPKLIASGANLEGIIKMIERFWYAKPGTIEIKGEDVYQSGKKMDGVKVVQAKGRYRFEQI